MPRTVFEALQHAMDPDAVRLFELGTESTGLYNHAFDTWNGVTHGDYINAVRRLLEDWIKTCGKKLGVNEANQFLSWIASGKCDDAAFLAKHKEAFANIFKWRAGFNQSMVIAARAAELNPKLTGAELKAIAQQIVNGAPTKPLSKAAARVAQSIIAGGKAALKATAKKILPGLMFLSAATAAKRGWAGQGHTGHGAWGALNEAARDIMSADLVEQIVFPKVLDTIDGFTNAVVPGLNDPSRFRYIRRGGRLYDMQTGRPID